MLSTNARSLRNKLIAFKALVATHTLDIIAITETWFSTESRDFCGEYELPGYAMFHRDRSERAGGGVLIYVRRHHTPISIPVVSQFEIIGVELRGCDMQIQVFVVYRPPHQTIEYDLALYNKLSVLLGDRRSLVVGDFNCKVSWNSLTAAGEGARLLDFANDNFLTQMVRVATRGSNILDLIFTTDEDIIAEVEIGDSLANSDHCTVFCQVLVGSCREKLESRQRLNLRRADYARFRRELSVLSPVSDDSADAMWTGFKGSFLAIQSICIPVRHSRDTAKVNPKWFHGGIARAIRERRRLYRLATSDPCDNNNNEQLTHQRRVVKRLVRSAKSDEEIRVATACRDNPKEFYAYVNQHKPRTPLGPILADDGELKTDNGAIAAQFNDYFTSVFTAESSDPPAPVISYGGVEPLVEITCTVAEVYAKVKSIDVNRACGPDGFLPKVLKSVMEEVSPHLCKIYNRSLATGGVPLDWRSANVAPIHKKGLVTDRSNFRPISLTSVPGKLLESIIKDRVVAFLDKHKLINESQHGFRAGRSTVTNLLEFYHQILQSLDNSGAVDIVFLDFKKAFDKVPHRRLLAKVRALGIGGDVARWIESWLADRRQRVVANGVSSGWSLVTSGVPQGSVLGPLLFLIYINDLDIGIESLVSKFADDTKLGINAAESTALAGLHADLLRIGEWSTRWLMPFNTDKCHVLHVGNANPKEEYFLLGAPVIPTSSEKDLGVLVTEDLKFSKQCIAAEKRAQKILGYVKRVFRHRTASTVLTLYHALVRPLLEYAVQFWSPTLQADIKRLERVQARATKLVPAIRHFGYARRLEALGLFTLEQRRLRGLLIEVFKILKGFSGDSPELLFTMNENSTRGHGLKVVAPRYNTSRFRDFPTVRVCNTWNSLPVGVVDAPSVDAFKSRLDKILPTLQY